MLDLINSFNYNMNENQDNIIGMQERYKEYSLKLQIINKAIDVLESINKGDNKVGEGRLYH
jgi:hypothetical protein